MMNICGPVYSIHVGDTVNYGNNLNKQIVNVLPNICIEIRNKVGTISIEMNIEYAMTSSTNTSGENSQKSLTVR